MDHLHEARQYLEAAERELVSVGGETDRVAEIDLASSSASALIGIGHALIEIAEALRGIPRAEALALDSIPEGSDW